jgi:hypothetical protein
MEEGDSFFCGMRYAELIAAAEHLDKAQELLIDINDQLIDGALDFLDITEKLSTAWNEINKCRVYTQDIVYFEELLIPAMGLVIDARMMIESLVQWRLGMTLNGKISIVTSIREAITDGVGPGIAQLESCMASA